MDDLESEAIAWLQSSQNELNGDLRKNSEQKLTLVDLPNECLKAILKKIPTKNMDDISEVCERWDKIVQENIPLDIWATDVGFRIGFRIFDRLEDMSKYSIRSLKTLVLSERFPPLKNPEALLEIEFVAQTTARTFQTLTNKTINLKLLYFGYGSLAFEDISGVHLNLPSLESINIIDKSFESKQTEISSTTLSNNILSLLNQYFPALKSLKISTVATRRVTERYTIQLLKFLQRHYLTVKKLSISIHTSIQRDVMNDFGSLEHVVVLQDETLQTLDWNNLFKVRLEELEMDLGHKFFVAVDEWHKILGNQDKLSLLKWALGKPLPPRATLPAVFLSASNLVTLQLGVQVYRREEPKTPIDCSCFEFCINLKCLILVSEPFCESQPLTKEIFNMDKLPSSIEEFGAENLIIETFDVEQIFFNLPVVRKISLENVGSEEEFGMTLPLISKILAQTQFSHIFVRGFNGKDCELNQYEILTQFRIELPLKSALLQVTFVKNFMEYFSATTATEEDDNKSLEFE